MEISIKQSVDFKSKKRLDMLKGRTKRCVCKYCGGELYIRQFSFNNQEDSRVEIFCTECDKIEFGVEKEIYANAKYYVEETMFNCFPDLDNNDRTKKMTIAKVCEIMTWENQNIGILTPDGFQIELNVNEHFVGECITLSDADLEKLDKE